MVPEIESCGKSSTGKQFPAGVKRGQLSSFCCWQEIRRTVFLSSCSRETACQTENACERFFSACILQDSSENHGENCDIIRIAGARKNALNRIFRIRQGRLCLRAETGKAAVPYPGTAVFILSEEIFFAEPSENFCIQNFWRSFAKISLQDLRRERFCFSWVQRASPPFGGLVTVNCLIQVLYNIQKQDSAYRLSRSPVIFRRAACRTSVIIRTVWLMNPVGEGKISRKLWHQYGEN